MSRYPFSEKIHLYHLLYRFSALKMDGRPLYEYARQGIPLPEPIPPRKVTIHSLQVVNWLEGHSHRYRWPEKVMSAAAKENLKKAVAGVSDNTTSLDDNPDHHGFSVGADGGEGEEGNDPRPPAFVLRMQVSGGTYVRSIAHDIGHAVGSAAHVVTLTRLRQGEFTTLPEKEGDRGCVPWEVFEEAMKEDEKGDDDNVERDEHGRRRWEREVLDKLVLYESS